MSQHGNYKNKLSSCSNERLILPKEYVELKGLSSFAQETARMINKMENEFYQNLAKEILGREPIIPNDAKLFKIIIYQNEGNKEVIAFNGVEIGEVQRNYFKPPKDPFRDGNNMTITFIPYNSITNLKNELKTNDAG